MYVLLKEHFFDMSLFDKLFKLETQIMLEYVC